MNRSSTSKAWQGTSPLDRDLQAESSGVTRPLAVPNQGWEVAMVCRRSHPRVLTP